MNNMIDFTAKDCDLIAWVQASELLVIHAVDGVATTTCLKPEFDDGMVKFRIIVGEALSEDAEQALRTDYMRAIDDTGYAPAPKYRAAEPVKHTKPKA